MPFGLDAIGRAPLRRLGALSVLLTLLIVLPGCWPIQQANAPSAITPQPLAATPQLTALPGAANTLNIVGQEQDPPTLDPAIATDQYSEFIVRQLFSGLVTFDNNLNVVPDLASSLPTVSADGKTYTFTLRRHVLFPDGQEVTAADFKYSIERAVDPKLAGPMSPTDLPAGIYFDDIVGVLDKLNGKASQVDGVQAPDPYTLQISIGAPRSSFLTKLAAGPDLVVERSNVESSTDWMGHPVGTGPYRLEKWLHNQQMVLASNPDYYGGRPKLARVNIWMGANVESQLQQYESGGLDVADVPVDSIAQLSDRNNPISRELRLVPGLDITYLGFNLRQKPFDDPKIREAFSRVIDRQGITRSMLESRVRPAAGFAAAGLPGYVPPHVAQAYDVTRARQLIGESTYKDVKNLPHLSLYTSGDPLGPVLHDVFSRTLGVKIDVHELEWSDYVAGLQRGDYQMFIMGSEAPYPDPEAFLGKLFRSDSPDNFTGYKNADVDAALATAAQERDSGKRMAIYSQVEARILMDYPAVPLFNSVQYTLVKPDVQGLAITPLGILSLSRATVGAR